MKKTAVVILNYNGKDFLAKFLPAVIEFSENASIVIADNCSTDDSVKFIEENYANQVELIINESNGGFAKGYNDALAKVNADYYVLLNSDIEVTANWMTPCLEILDNNSEIVAVQPKILAYNNKNKFEHAGAAGGFLDKDYFPFCQGRIFDHTEEDTNQYNENKEIFWATGACLFIRAEAYHEVGGLDEDFFAHMEEIDMCWRLKTRGHKIFYCANAHIYHVGGGTLNYNNPRKTYLNFRNSLYMLTKNYSGILFFKLVKRMVLDGIAACLFIVKGQFSHFLAVFRAHMHFYGKLGRFLKKRKAEKPFRKTFNKTGLYRKSIVFGSFLNGIKSFKELDQTKFEK